jgi:hypothetical protein
MFKYMFSVTTASVEHKAVSMTMKGSKQRENKLLGCRCREDAFIIANIGPPDAALDESVD